MTGPVEITVDTEEAQRELDSLKRGALITAQTVIRTVRRGYATISLFARASGQAIDLSLDMLVQSMFLYAEALTLQATAEGVLGSPRALLLASMATLMFYRAIVLAGQKSEVTEALDTFLTAGNIWL
jgi:hypothetical protein